MRQRVITAIVALAIFIPIIIFGGIWIDVAALVLAGVAISEILIMKKIILVSPEAIISSLGTLFLVLPNSWLNNVGLTTNRQFIFYIFVIILLVRMVFSRNRLNFDDVGTLTLSMLYIGYGFNMFITARGAGLATILYVLLTVWITDSGAYLIGRRFGKNKLAPQISPNKTWEGSIGGMIAAVIFGVIYALFVPFHYSWMLMIVVSLILSITGQVGDLVESSLKRFYGVKDSGRILPGHGGILDRFDSLLLVLPIAHLLGLF